MNARVCATCGHSSDYHAFSDGYVSPLPHNSPEVDFGPTHCHALGWPKGADCEQPFCKCPDFRGLG